MKLNQRILWIVRTGILIALLVVLQGITAPAGQLVTGSCVNLILLLAVFLSGIWSGLTVALLSPFFAFLFGIGPALLQLVPFIAVGNLIYVTVAWAIGHRGFTVRTLWGTVQGVVGIVIGAIAKFLFLWLGLSKGILPLFLNAGIIKAPQMEKFSAMFATPQLITALIGGVLTVPAVLLLQKAFAKKTIMNR